MSDKTLPFYALIFILIVACAMFIVWRLQRLAAQKREAEHRAVGAFEEMNKLTKELRERGKAEETDQSEPPGERLQHLYPGAKPPSGGPPAA